MLSSYSFPLSVWLTDDALACPERLSAGQASNGLLRAREIHVCVDGLISGHHVCPILNVVVGVYGREDGVVHVSILRASAEVEKIEFYCLSIWRGPRDHTRTVSGVAIMDQSQVFVIQVEHRDWMIVL